MKIYTKTGDQGETGLFGGARVSKASERVHAYGEIDELNSTLGVVRASGVSEAIDAELLRIQSELFDLGSELATKPGQESKLTMLLVSDEQIKSLEQAVDRFEEGLSPLKTFILPGGSLSASHLHVARCVCRRAERRVVFLRSQAPEQVRLEVVRYLNRLSDLLFTLARAENARAHIEDVPWVGRDRANITCL